MIAFAWVLACLAPQEEPIKLHPENPHYFLFRGKPTILITSAEHYGAVMNLDFDYVPYLDELQTRGFNQTRLFTGVVREVNESFSIAENTMNPGPGRYLCPWAKSPTPGYFDGGNKYDLDRWDDAYFKRLKDFVAQAARRGVVVEVVLFNTLYNDALWNVCPLNAKNNVNGVGAVPRMEVWTLKHPTLVEVQDAMVRKIVTELKDFDNVYYEGCNEPYERKLPEDWQNHVTATIAAAETTFAFKHLIAQNTGNGLMKISNPNPLVSVFNYHYANPPDAVAAHWGLNRVLGFDETGGRGQADLPYRTDAWSFILAGGAVYSNLDYSFTPSSPAGAGKGHPYHSGGSASLRAQLKVLKDYVHGFDFIRMKPDRSFLKRGLPPGAAAQALTEPGKAYALYLHLNEKSSVRWTGKLIAKSAEKCTLTLSSNDGARLYVNDALLIDNWADYAGSDLATEKSAAIDLAENQKVDLRVEHYDRGGHAAARLSWSSPTRKPEVIPRTQFELPDGSGPGLKAEYFEGSNFEVLRRTQTDAVLNFNRPDGSLTLFPEVSAKAQVTLTLDLPPGTYRAEWITPRSGQVDKTERFDHPGGERAMPSSVFSDDVALSIRNAAPK